MSTPRALDDFARANGDPVRVFFPPTAEQLFWVRHFGWLVSPPDNQGGVIARVFRLFGVTPIAHLAQCSLTFQAYLYEVFHQTWLARLGHFVLMPAVIVAIMVGLAPIGAHPATHAPVLFAWNGALVFAGVLAVWYLIEAVVAKMLTWGVVMVALTGVLYVLSNLIYYQVFTLDPALRAWYAPTPLAWNPILWALLLSFATAATHALDPCLPPRASLSNRWVNVQEYLRGPADQPRSLARTLLRGAQIGVQIFFGSVDELWATPRLFPIGVLRQLWRLGYQPARRAELEGLVQRALAEGNPALDYVGTGGGAFLQMPKEKV